MMEVTTSGPVVIVLSKKASPVEVLVFLEEVFIRDPEELGQSAYLVRSQLDHLECSLVG
jgi:hypothetical protein